MGGSSGGSSYDTTPSSGFDCSNINIITNVSSPDALVLATVRVGDLLQYELVGEILVVKKSGNRLGSIVFGQIQELVNCLRGGTKISIEVIDITGGICKVHITNS